jgi:hypothetical protein
MTESDLNKKLIALIKAIWPRQHLMWHRVENVAAIGTFDVFFGTPLGSGWIELKVCGPNAKPDVRPGQPGFGERCYKAGVPAHYLCGSNAGYIKLLDGRCMGPDWREWMVMEAQFDSHGCMADLLMKCIAPPVSID